MMKKHLTLIALFLASSIVCVAQLNNDWRKNTEMQTYDRKRVYEAPSGNVLLARMDDYYGIGDGNDLIQCYSPDGTLLWGFGEEDFTDNSGSNFIDIDFDSESNAYICGSNFPITASYPKSEVIKLSPTGQEFWRINFTAQADWSEEVMEIEITNDNRIFLLAQLYNGDAQTIIPHFLEIDQTGQTITNIPDLNFNIGYAQLFEPGDGFLYGVDSDHLVKIGFDGSIVWSAPFDFGDGVDSYFPYEGTEFNVEFKDNKIFTCQQINDPMGTEQYFGISVFSTDGQLEQALTYTILPDLAELLSINPLHFDIDSNGNLFVVGDFSYGQVQGPTVIGEDDNGDRGGKGGSFHGVFATRINAAYEQNWTINYFEDDPAGPKYPVGTFLNNDRIVVVYQLGFSGSESQLAECYDNITSSIAWSHTEGTNDVFTLSNPSGSYLDQSGALYTFGVGGNQGEFGIVSEIYLYKYEMTASGIYENANLGVARLWPNPAADHLTVKLESNDESIAVFNSYGQLCFSQNVKSSITTLDISSFTPGMYTLQIFGVENENIKFVKQ